MTKLADLRPAACRGLLLLTVAVTPLAAAEYEVSGNVTAIIDGESFDLWVPYDAETDTRYAQQIGSGVMSTVTIEAFSGEPGEAMEKPGVVLSIFGPPSRATVTSLRIMLPEDPADKAWTAGTEYPGEIDSAEVRRDGNVVEFSIAATPVQVDGMLGEPVSDDGAESKTMQVSIEGEANLAD